jgi:hypothetical protein
VKGGVARDHQEERLELCRRASVEQDREKLFQLVRRINMDTLATDARPYRNHSFSLAAESGQKEASLIRAVFR